MSKDEDKRLEGKEKIEAEIARSLSVAKMKEAHKQIEDIEKLRKQASIRSICERISVCWKASSAILGTLVEARKLNPNQKFSWKIADSDDMKRYIDNVMALYESIYFDFQSTIEVKKEDFDKLFPKMEFSFSTVESIISNLNCLCIRLADMKSYCLRSL